MINDNQLAELSSLEDNELVALAAAGDQDAVNTVISRYYPSVRCMAAFYHSKNSFCEAEDLLQEGLIGLLFAIQGFKSDKGTGFKTYLSTCMSRSMLGKIRHDKRSFSLSDFSGKTENDDLSLIPGDDSDNPEQIFILKEEVSRLTGLIYSRLTDFEREAVIHFLGGFSYAQIAQKLGCSTKAVDNALQRVRRKLRT